MTVRSSLISDYEAAVDWWRAAGVDSDFADDVTTWLVEPEAASEQAPSEPPLKKPAQPSAIERALAPQKIAEVAGDRKSWPADIAAFREWWMAEPTLDASRAGERIVSRGPVNAELMVVVAMPDEGDAETLLTGIQGKVLTSFLRSAKVEESGVYVASALPRRVAMPDWDDLTEAGIGNVARHHIVLTKAKRLLIFGRAVADLVAAESGMVEDMPTLAAPSLENLARSPVRKRRFWNNWLEWTAR